MLPLEHKEVQNVHMTPSEAHDTAFNRTPEHDEMVVSVYENMKRNGCAFNPVYKMRYDSSGSTHSYENSWVECEKMYIGKRMFFSDLSVIRWSDVPGRTTKRYSHHLLLEVKPKIYSAGAVLRQIKAQQNLIDDWCKDLGERDFDKSSWATVAPVFKNDDPLLEIFTRMIEPDQVYFIWNDVDKSLKLKRNRASRAA